MINEETIKDAKAALDALTYTLLSATEEANEGIEAPLRIKQEEAVEMLCADLEDMCYYVMGADREISEAEENMFDTLFGEFGMKARRTETSRREIKELSSVIKNGMPRTLALFCEAAGNLGGKNGFPSEKTDEMFTEVFTCYIKLMCHVVAADGEVKKREVGALCDYIEGLCSEASAQTGLRIDFKQEYVDLSVSLLS